MFFCFGYLKCELIFEHQKSHRGVIAEWFVLINNILITAVSEGWKKKIFISPFVKNNVAYTQLDETETKTRAPTY